MKVECSVCRQSWGSPWLDWPKEWHWLTGLDFSRKMSWRWISNHLNRLGAETRPPSFEENLWLRTIHCKVLELTGLACPTILGKGKAIIDGGFPTHQPLQHMQKVRKAIDVLVSDLTELGPEIEFEHGRPAGTAPAPYCFCQRGLHLKITVNHTF